MLNEGFVTTPSGTLPIGDGVTEVSICVHSDTPVRQFTSVLHIYNLLWALQGSVEIAQTVKRLVEESNAKGL